MGNQPSSGETDSVPTAALITYSVPTEQTADTKTVRFKAGDHSSLLQAANEYPEGALVSNMGPEHLQDVLGSGGVIVHDKFCRELLVLQDDNPATQKRTMMKLSSN